MRDAMNSHGLLTKVKCDVAAWQLQISFWKNLVFFASRDHTAQMEEIG